ncbi:Protein-tyrosine-phosphatase [Cohaesibacter sp. ES.047]|uniref:arsenate-mycothiol transferase ArsC n=1 Tax=Cohaesibacter sp. ES.047 TaxID=1798205 RepID=UPI000BB9656C|nr:low molecular weight phosphatase family protein [Cohaesibacter sp. ES.047]SNY91984.1 Protein-tyrosine-phosphatase [Cohaesibacter sp. ES.047]
MRTALGGVFRPSSVLFACGMNAIRSPMAAALSRHLFPGSFYVKSVGVRCGKPDPFAAAVMEEIGLDISEHEPSTFDDLEDSYFDLIISLAPEAHHRALEWSRSDAVETEYWPTLDPALANGSREQIMDSYRGVRDGLIAKLKDRFEWVSNAGG